jgi:flagellar assembly factor FliW
MIATTTRDPRDTARPATAEEHRTQMTEPEHGPSETGTSAESVAADLPVIELVHPMPGFPTHRRFALVRLDEDGVLCALRSLDDPELRFLVVPPHAFFPEYAPVIDDATASELGVTRAEDVLLLSVLTAGPSLADTTANLLAPVLVNTHTQRACQVVLDDPALSTHTPLVA